jgi:F0F1-type ATP synthase membrane subunit c/vacuolar-type H+-ATPase subunit K
MPFSIGTRQYLKHMGGMALAGSTVAGSELAQQRLHAVSKEDRPTKKQVIGNLAGGAVVGGALGAVSAKASLRNVPAWARAAKNKTEAKSIFRSLARKHHPDLGGNAEKMKQVNDEWAKFEKTRLFNKLSAAAFLNELEKFADVGLQEAAIALPGLIGGYRAGRAVAGHSAAGTAPHGSKTRSEDIARRIGMVTAPAGAVGGMALARHKKWGEAAANYLAKKAPKGLVMNPAAEHAMLRSAVIPGLAALGGGALAGYLTGKGVGYAARLRDGRTRSDS